MICALLDYRKISPHANHKHNRRLPPSRKHEEDDFMKKLIAIAVVFALAAGAVFAQDLADGVVKPGLTVSGSAGATWVPLRFEGPLSNGYGGVQTESKWGYPDNTWGAPSLLPEKDQRGDFYSRVDGYNAKIKIAGTSAYAGFEFTIRANNSLVVDQDGTNFWLKPFGTNVLKFNFKRTDGSIGISNGGGFDWGGTLNRWNAENSLTGFDGDSIQIYSEPLGTDMLQIGVAIGGRDGNGTGLFKNANGANNAWVAANVWRSVQVGAAFKIPDIGTVKAAYFGGWAGNIKLNSLTDDQYNNLVIGNSKVPYLEKSFAFNEKMDGKRDRAFFTAGFLLKAISMMDIDLGARIYLPLTVSSYKDIGGSRYDWSVKDDRGVNLGLGVQFRIVPEFTLNLSASAIGLGRMQTVTANTADGIATVKYSYPIQSGIFVNPSIKVGTSTIDLRFGVMMQGEDFLDVRMPAVENSYKIKAPGFEEKGSFLAQDFGGTGYIGRSTVQYTFGASYKLPVGPGTIQAGVAVNTPNMYTNDNDKTLSTEKWGKGPIKDQRLIINVPVAFSVSF